MFDDWVACGLVPLAWRSVSYRQDQQATEKKVKDCFNRAITWYFPLPTSFSIVS